MENFVCLTLNSVAHGDGTIRQVPVEVEVTSQPENTKANKRWKPVYQYTVNGSFIKEWPSVSEIERQTGIKQATISACCRGINKLYITHGYQWRYDKI